MICVFQKVQLELSSFNLSVSSYRMILKLSDIFVMLQGLRFVSAFLFQGLGSGFGLSSFISVFGCRAHNLLKAKAQDSVFNKKDSSLIKVSYLRHKTR